jgi:hypothetical protein
MIGHDSVLGCCLIVGLLLLASGAVDGKAVLGFESGIAFLPTESLVDLESTFMTFQAGYYKGNVASLSNRFLRKLFLTDGSLTDKGFGVQTVVEYPLFATDQGGSLSLSIYAKSDMVIEWPIGTWSVISNLAFSTLTSDLSRWWTTANISAYGSSVTLAFALVPTAMGIATGLSIDISGPSLGGMGVAIGASFGMPTTFDDIGSFMPSASCQLEFREATVGFDGVRIGCLSLDMETTFGCEGYESTVIGFDLDLSIDELTIEGDIDFSPNAKAFTLIPRLQFEPECIWINVGISPEVWESTSMIDTLVIRGMGISNLAIDSARYSAVVSFVGGVYREMGADDLDLRAHDYYVAIDPEADASDYILLPYDMIVSVEYSEGNSDLALDVYFGSPESDLFDVALLNVELLHRLSSELEVYVGASLDPNDGAQTTLVFGFEASVVLP